MSHLIAEKWPGTKDQSTLTSMPRILCLGLAALALVVPGVVHARSEKTLGYSPKDVWSPTVRFVRVDENLTILERDAELGYILFELREDKKVFRGSVEIIAASADHGARVIVDLRERPSYMEVAMLERLERKLIAELGPAPAPPKKKEKEPARPAPDESGDGDKPKGKDPRKAERRRETLPEAPTVPLPEPET